MNRDLFYEIGTEEIPARFIKNALKEINDLLTKNLEELRIEFDEILVQTTPRRFAIVVKNIGASQSDVKEEFKGPSKKIAFDQDGNPTKALIGFAKGKGGNPANVVVKEVNGEEYVYLTIEKNGQATKLFVKDILENIIRGMNFPKPMKWGGKNLKFIRPIRWLICCYHGEHVNFDIEGIETTKITRGHRFLGKPEIEVNDFEDYKNKLRENFVILDQDERRAKILEGVKKIAEEINGEAIIDQDILEEVNFIVEYPTAFYGSYSKEYLSLPEEVIITPMEAHQRYFPVRGKDGKLINYFITVRNGNDYMIDNVRKGNEKVLVARLQDAEFFFKEDTKKPLESFVANLETITFQQKLGTMMDKINRIDKFAHLLADKLNMDSTYISRGAFLAKADLTTHMVFEFTELQGIMGRYYAQLNNEPVQVSEGIFEHYLPRNATDHLPKTDLGILLSIADKMDSITGFFSIGVQPTGSQDPYALRRQALGVINILMNNSFDLTLNQLINLSIDQFETTERDLLEKQLTDFFNLRVNNLLLEAGIRYDVVNAVVENKQISLYHIKKLAQEVSEYLIKDRSEILNVATRIKNLLKNNSYDEINEDGFISEFEIKLNNLILQVSPKVNTLANESKFKLALEEIEILTLPVNNLFDNVMIMDENPGIRLNRLSLLSKVSQIIEQILDVTQINYK